MIDAQTVVAAAGSAGGTLIAFGTWLRSISRKVDGVHDQVHNRHPPDTNLREDIDKVRDIVQDVQGRTISQGKDIGFIRRELTSLRVELDDERERSITVDNHLQRRIDKLGGQ